MATIYNKCATCGGALELKDGVRVCLYCGNTYSISNPRLEDELASKPQGCEQAPFGKYRN